MGTYSRLIRGNNVHVVSAGSCGIVFRLKYSLFHITHNILVLGYTSLKLRNVDVTSKDYTFLKLRNVDVTSKDYTFLKLRNVDVNSKDYTFLKLRNVDVTSKDYTFLKLRNVDVTSKSCGLKFHPQQYLHTFK